MLLAIDTSAGTSVAVVDSAAGVWVERSVNDTRRHAEVIGELIAECMAAAGASVAGASAAGASAAGASAAGVSVAGASVSDIASTGASLRPLSGVAVGMGPGPFTGLRVGIAAATAFALGAQLPLFRVVSHDAVAFDHYRVAERAAAREPVLVTTDARRHERYWSAYRGIDAESVPLRVLGPGLDRPETIPSAITDIDSYLRLDVDWVSAASVGALAELLQTHSRDFASAEPLYLRSPDVTPSAGPKRVSS